MQFDIKKDWGVYIKKKFRLSDNDFLEYCESFSMVTKKPIINVTDLMQFMNRELKPTIYTISYCLKLIQNINMIVHKTKNNHITLETYLLYIIPICQKYNVNDITIKELFDKLDKKREGKIKSDELIQILYKLNKNFTPDEIKKHVITIKKMCIKIDVNNDGFIDFNEFKNFIKKL